MISEEIYKLLFTSNSGIFIYHTPSNSGLSSLNDLVQFDLRGQKFLTRYTLSKKSTTWSFQVYAYFIYTPKHVGFVLSQGPQPHSTVVLPYSGERQRSHTIHQCLINLCHHLWSQRDPGLFQGTTRMSTRTQGIN